MAIPAVAVVSASLNYPHERTDTHYCMVPANPSIKVSMVPTIEGLYTVTVAVDSLTPCYTHCKDLTDLSVRASTGAASPGLDAEQVIQESTDKVVVEEEARGRVSDQEGEDWETWEVVRPHNHQLL